MKHKYKEIEEGKIPIDWKVEKIKDVFKITAGGDINKEDFSKEKNDKFKYNVYSNTLTNKGLFGYYSQYDYEGNYITVTARGGIGKAESRINDKFKPVGRLLILNKLEKLNEYYISQYINNFVDFKIESTGVPQLTAPQIGNYRIILPPIEEQEKIASILSKIDENIENIENLIIKTKELKKGLMQELLTKGIGHAEYKETEIGKIPVEWKIEKLENIGEIITGTTPKTSEKENYGGEYIWVSPADINQNKYIENSVNNLSERGFEKTRKLKIGSILVTCIGSTIGKMAIANKEMSTNQQINSIIVNDNYNNEYIYYIILYKFEDYKSQISQQAVPIINKTTFSKLKFSIPPIEEQRKIANILSSVDKQIEEYEKKKEKLEELKKGLMQNLLTGKIRVKI